MQSSNGNKLYISKKLSQAISAITVQPLTLIMAGAGFGKTTAVENYLKQLPCSTAFHWYTCYGESRERAWEGISHLISFADNKIEV